MGAVVRRTWWRRGGAARVAEAGEALWVAAERVEDVRAARCAGDTERNRALRELLRGRLSMLGPVRAHDLCTPLGVEESDVDAALLALEGEGAILRGSFTPGVEGREWCDRRLLARIHRQTIHRLRAGLL